LTEQVGKDSNEDEHDSELQPLVFSGVAKMARLNDDMYNPVCRELLRSWLKDCDNSHDACGSLTQRFLPTRLLDLGEVDAKQRVRVVLSQDLDPNTSYVSLSHCWGANVPFQLTTSSIAMMREGFDLAELPPTFRDAIDVARWADGTFDFCSSIINRTTADTNLYSALHLDRLMLHTATFRL
jgi:hypothetical protein